MSVICKVSMELCVCFLIYTPFGKIWLMASLTERAGLYTV